jgi:hypothetical protein
VAQVLQITHELQELGEEPSIGLLENMVSLGSLAMPMTPSPLLLELSKSPTIVNHGGLDDSHVTVGYLVSLSDDANEVGVLTAALFAKNM